MEKRFSNRDLLIHQANNVLFHFGQSERSTVHFTQTSIYSFHLSLALPLFLHTFKLSLSLSLCAAIRIQIDCGFKLSEGLLHLYINHRSNNRRYSIMRMHIWLLEIGIEH